jgi:all-trans-retinol 13,14-reductase
MIMMKIHGQKLFMASMNASKKQEAWAEGMTFITYMKYDDVAPWMNTFNTTVEENDRGECYEEFKTRKTSKFLDEIELKFPGIKDCIRSIHTSTPLSYRDYIGGHNGNMYGYVKDSGNPMKTLIPSKTKLDRSLSYRTKHQHARCFGSNYWSCRNLF